MPHTDSIDERKPIQKAWPGVTVVLIAIVFFVTIAVVKPAMPDRILLLTGPETSAYHELGVRYAEDLGRQGLDAQVIVTGGALDNLRRLGSGANVVAFAPATIDWNSTDDVDTSHLVALGSVGFEPLWLFHRADLDISRISDLTGRRVATEGEGTTSECIARWLIDHNDLTNNVELRHLVGANAKMFLRGFADKTIDAVFVTGKTSSPIVKSMLAARDSEFMSFERADAYAKTFPGVTTIVASEGVFDLARNVPPQESQLLANTTCLIARDSLHPAVVPLLLATAENLRQTSTTFSTEVTFPSSQHVTLPLDRAAGRFFRQGEVGLSKFLPYRVTRTLNHLGFLVLPLVTVAIVFLKAIPAGLRIWVGLRFKRLLKRLAGVEKGYAAGDDQSRLLADLDRIDRASASMFVPGSNARDYVDLRQSLHDMRERVTQSEKPGTRPLQ